ncbi:MAG: tol-pal system protein YbgF, partial [Candidatus Aminicenantes bacterium]|nr:tol-pal system protein YbgF [Candidatus Aminicenantes bacterium]
MRRIDWMKGWMLLCVVLFLWGCATRRDVVILDKETNRLQGQLHAQQKERESFHKDLEKLQKEFAALQKETNDLKSSVTVESKKGQADLLLQLETLQAEVKTLATEMEEYKELLKKPPKEMDRLRENIVLQTKALEDREKVFEEKDKALEERIRVLEERLKGLEEKIGQLASKQLELEGAIPTKEVASEVKGISTRAGDLYKDAYETLQKGAVEGARRKFEAFLKQYPNTDLSDNAQFWIAETYYLKKDFEKAILEYEKAITKYPEGDKIPAALFKQAFAFLELGDKTNGRNLLKRVIERYPNSEQAQMAKKKLET